MSDGVTIAREMYYYLDGYCFVLTACGIGRVRGF